MLYRWKISLEEDSRCLRAAVTKILSVLDLPPLDSFTTDGQDQQTPASQQYVQERAAPPVPGRTGSTVMAMTRENSQEPESTKLEEALFSAPMGSLYEVTKLRNLRSNLQQRIYAPRPTLLEEDFISKGMISEAEAKELFELFRTSLNHYLWGGIALVHETLVSVRRSSSLLLVAILTVTALHIPGREHIFDICYGEYTKLICESMLDRYHTLDGIRGLCIGAFWLSDVSWKLSGHAVRIATELNLHQCYSRAVRGSREHIEGARLWYLLYVCDHHFSIAYGRPPVIHETETIVDHEKFLSLPETSQADIRLHSQISLFIILTDIYNTFGPDIERMLSENDLGRLPQFNIALDAWRMRWEPRLAPNRYVSNYPAYGVTLHYNFAKLQVNSLALRGLEKSTVQEFTVGRRQFANTAIGCAMAILNSVLDIPDIRNSVVGVPLYLHTMITYSAVFLLNVRQKWRMFNLSADAALIRNLVTRVISLLQESKASERHLTCHMAIGLQKILDRFTAWERQAGGSNPGKMPLQQHDTAPQSSIASRAGVGNLEMNDNYGVVDYYGDTIPHAEWNYFPMGFFDIMSSAQFPNNNNFT
ncbi:hypothetical protein BP6252_12900 [Coleophoma cylindrospora]|uniref:Xylanolytic transcriptional activator regulatory domain-containing protein n=1 Tax=Coleophoma cylindrospora TaxID=1849047 RepID=A0A3D8QD81_9HELO|nr:hypothetical protein BP6252_12900 [Coleophoma cylindrospora]